MRINQCRSGRKKIRGKRKKRCEQYKRKFNWYSISLDDVRKRVKIIEADYALLELKVLALEDSWNSTPNSN